MNNSFKAGRLKNYERYWRNLTSDEQILDIACHCHFEFVNNIEPVRNLLDRPYNFSKIEEIIIDNEIKNMLNIGVIEEV